MTDVAAPDAGPGAGGPNSSVPFGQAGPLQQLARQGRQPGPPPGAAPAGAPPSPGGAPPSAVQPPPQMGVPTGSPIDMRNGPVTPGQVQANFTPAPRQSMAWRDGLAALAHNGPALAALHQIASRAAGQQQQ